MNWASKEVMVLGEGRPCTRGIGVHPPPRSLNIRARGQVNTQELVQFKKEYMHACFVYST